MERLRRSPILRSSRSSRSHGAAGRSSTNEHPLLELQRLAGNRAVATLVQREEDEQWDEDDSIEDVVQGVEEEVDEDDRALVDDSGGATGPATEAADDTDTDEEAPDVGPSLEELDAAFDPDAVVATMAAQGVGDFDAPGPSDVAQAIRVQRDPEPGKEEPAKAASAGDLLNALSKVEEVKQALDRLKALLEKSWEDIKKGTTTPEKVVVFTTAGLILGGAVAGGLANRDSRGFLFKTLDGTKLPIPGLDGVSITPKLDEKGLQGGTVNVDVLKLVPALRKVPIFQ